MGFKVPDKFRTGRLCTDMDENRVGAQLSHSDSSRVEWVEIVEPQTRQRMYANLCTGQCAWEPPPGVAVKRTECNQWWELFDTNTRRFYYYNATTMKTVWQKPTNCDIIPLAKLQTLKENTEARSSSERDVSSTMILEKGVKAKRNSETQTSPKEERRAGSSRSIAHAVYAQNISPETGIISARHLNSPHASLSRQAYVSSPSAMDSNWAYQTPNVNSLQDMRIYAIAAQQRNLAAPPSVQFIPRSDSFESRIPQPFPQSLMSARTSSSSNSAGAAVQPSFMHSSARSSSSSLTMSNSRFPLEDSSGSFAQKFSTPTPSPKSREMIEISSEACWTKYSIKHPVSGNFDDKQLRKDAGSLFKLVQSYMGDRKSKTSPDQLALSLCEFGLSRESFADELFCQIIKQLTLNNKYDSLRRGWELLAIFLSFFGPSNEEVVQKLSNLVKENSDRLLDPPELPVSYYAIQCNRRLLRLSSKRQKPTLSLIQESRVHIFDPPQFSAPLEELMELQAEKYPGRCLPWLEITLIDLIIAADGQHTEGLFRVPANPDHVHTARLRLDRGFIPVVRDAHVPAALLKLWLRSLPEPLLPDDFYSDCLSVCDQADKTCRIIERLPTLNRLVLAKLLELLQILAEEETVKHTRMDVCNLAMVMAPNVLRCVSDDPRVIFDNARREMTFMKTLITHFDTSFVRSLL